MKFKMAAATILNLLFLSTLVKWSIFGGSQLHHCKISLSMSIGGRDIAVCAKIQDGGGRHLKFNFCSIFWHICMKELQRNTRAIFHANMCNSERVMKDKWNSKWRPPPSWIYNFCPFWSNGLFPVAADYIAAKFHSSASIGGWVIAVCAKIQNGGRRHLKFIIFVHFGQMVYFRWQPATSLQNFIHLRQSAAELLLFVQKSKMAAAAILDFIFV